MNALGPAIVLALIALPPFDNIDVESPAETLPYILSLLGIAGAGASLAMMDAGIRRRRTLEAVKRIIIRESLKQPLVVIFEDLH